MKKSLITTALLGFASAAISVSTANAATIFTGPGDLILGFYASSGTGSGSTVEVDLGSATNYDNATPGKVINLSGVNGLSTLDLSTTYGAGFASDTSLQWGVAAGNAVTSIPGVPFDTVWVSDPEIHPGTLNTPWTTDVALNQQTPSDAIETINGGMNAMTSTANSNVTIIFPAAQGNSWAFQDDLNVPGSSFGYFVPTIDNKITNTATSGTLLGGGNASGYSLSDFYLLNPNAPVNSNGQLLGQFQFNASTGVFRFVAAVPEPSSIGLTGVGFLSLIGFVALRRRRSIMA